MLRLATVICVIAVQGCTLGPDTELKLEVDSTDPAVVAETARVLAARFEEAQPTMFSSARFVIEGSTVRFTFKNGAPEPTILERLYQTPGHLRAAPVTEQFGSPWFTERDVVDVTVVYRDSMYVLRVRLTAEAGQRMVRLTTENLGQVVKMTLDGVTMMEARVNGVFGDRFEIGGGQLDLDSASALVIILTTAALPAAVRAVPAGAI